MNSQMSPDQIIAIILANVIPLVVFGCCGLVIQGVICWFLSTCLQKVPEQFRQIAPMSPYIFLAGVIPCVGWLVVVVYNFIFWPKFCRSFKAYFDSVGNTEVGDCGEKFTLIYSIGTIGVILVSMVSIIPILGFFISLINCILGPALFVLFVLILIKAAQMKGMIADAPGGEITAPPPPPPVQ